MNVNENGEIAWLVGSGAPCQAGDATVTFSLNNTLSAIQLFTIAVDGAPGDQISWASAGGAVHDCVTYRCDGLLNVLSNNTSQVFPAPSACTPAKNISFQYNFGGVEVFLDNLSTTNAVQKLDGVIHIQPNMNGISDLDFTSQSYSGGPLMDVIKRKNADGSFDFYYKLRQNWIPLATNAAILVLQHSEIYNASQGAQLVCSAAFGRGAFTNVSVPDSPIMCALSATTTTLTIPGAPACGNRLLISASRYVGSGCELGIKYVLTHNAPAPIQLASLKLRFRFKLFNGTNTPGTVTTTLPCPACGTLTNLGGARYEYNYNQTNLTLNSGAQIIVPFNLNLDCISYYVLAAEAVPAGGTLCALAAEYNLNEYPVCNPQVVGSVRMADEAPAPFYRVDLLSTLTNPPNTVLEDHTDCAYDYSFCPNPATAPFRLYARLGTGWGSRPHCSCGVTTYDLVLITKHILGLQALPSPYAIIAADANKSSSVVTQDIMDIRKCILGIQKDYGSNSAEPWYYIRKNYVFPIPQNPFNPGTYINANVSDVPTVVNTGYGKFIAVHTGDVNHSCNCGTNLLGGADRSAGVEISVDAQRIQKNGRILTVPFYASAASDLVAAQFGLRFDPSVLRLREIVPNPKAKVASSDFGTLEAGLINFAWSTPDGETALVKQTSLFTLSFDLLEEMDPATLNELIWSSESTLAGLAYTADGTELPLRLAWQNTAAAPVELRVIANPNPFTQSTQVYVSVEAAKAATVRLTNAQGAILSTQQLDLPAGETILDLEAVSHASPGVYFLTVETAQAKVVRRLVKI